MSLYIGPYVSARYKYEPITRSAGYARCENKLCPKPQSFIYLPSKYCSVCGSLAIEVMIEKTTEPKPFDLIGDSPLVSIDYCLGAYTHCFILNDSSVLDRETSINLDDEYSLDVLGLDIKYETILLEDACAEQLRILKQNYREIDISWGILNWFYK